MITVSPCVVLTPPVCCPEYVGPFIQTSRLVSLSRSPKARVGNVCSGSSCIRCVAGGVDGAIAPEPRIFASRLQPGSDATRDFAEWRPFGPSVGDDPPLLHAWELAAGGFSNAGKVFTFEGKADERGSGGEVCPPRDPARSRRAEGRVATESWELLRADMEPDEENRVWRSEGSAGQHAPSDEGTLNDSA